MTKKQQMMLAMTDFIAGWSRIGAGIVFSAFS
jgi:hypothetical protein